MTNISPRLPLSFYYFCCCSRSLREPFLFIKTESLYKVNAEIELHCPITCPIHVHYAAVNYYNNDLHVNKFKLVLYANCLTGAYILSTL